MTLDETIKEFTDWAKDNRKEQNYWVAERNESYDETNPLSYADCEGLARDAETRAEYHEQLAEWLTELKQWRRVYGICPGYEMCIPECKEGYNAQIAEYKRLLKAAVEDLNATVAEVYNGGVICECCKWESQIGECCCPGDGGCDTDYRWRYADEAQKLLNDEK